MKDVFGMEVKEGDEVLFIKNSRHNPTLAKGRVTKIYKNDRQCSVDDFSLHVAKYVREGHVQTDKHWSLQAITTNKLEETHENYNCR